MKIRSTRKLVNRYDIWEVVSSNGPSVLIWPVTGVHGILQPIQAFGLSRNIATGKVYPDEVDEIEVKDPEGFESQVLTVYDRDNGTSSPATVLVGERLDLV